VVQASCLLGGRAGSIVNITATKQIQASNNNSKGGWRDWEVPGFTHAISQLKEHVDLKVKQGSGIREVSEL
jgi:hypothetical protein